MTIFDNYAARYERTKEEEMSMKEYLDLCKKDRLTYASAPERMLAAGHPETTLGLCDGASGENRQDDVTGDQDVVERAGVHARRESRAETAHRDDCEKTPLASRYERECGDGEARSKSEVSREVVDDEHPKARRFHRRAFACTRGLRWLLCHCRFRRLT